MNKFEISGFIEIEDGEILIKKDNTIFSENFVGEIELYIDKKYKTNQKILEENLGGHSYYIPKCSVRFYVSDEKISFTDVEEKHIRKMIGDLEVFGEYCGYSEWTITGFDLEKFTIGDHDLKEILIQYNGKYINFRMEW